MTQRHIVVTYSQPISWVNQVNVILRGLFDLTWHRGLQLKSRDGSTDCPWFLQSWVYPTPEWNWTSMWWKKLVQRNLNEMIEIENNFAKILMTFDIKVIVTGFEPTGNSKSTLYIVYTYIYTLWS